jgi:hypothetical protein
MPAYLISSIHSQKLFLNDKTMVKNLTVLPHTEASIGLRSRQHCQLLRFVSYLHVAGGYCFLLARCLCSVDLRHKLVSIYL